ncbi:MAG: DUF5821 family protein [Haloferacaceae archaeon]
MALVTDRRADGLADVLQAGVDATGDPLHVVDPDASAVEALVDVLATESDPPETYVTTGESALKQATEDFLVASRAADLVADGTLSLAADEAVGHTLLVADGTVHAVVRADGRVAALSTDDDEFVRTAVETARARADDADPFSLRTPPLSRVRETLAETAGEEALSDFDAALDACHEADVAVPEVTLSLLVAARNDVLLYDVSRWGEDVGIASKATFSRTKSRLEDAGLVDTEKVPIEVGRPRLRLKAGTDTVRGDPADLVEVLRDLD